MLTTLIKKTPGSVAIAGHDPDKDAPAIRRVIGVQSQDAVTDHGLTERENLAQCPAKYRPGSSPRR